MKTLTLPLWHNAYVFAGAMLLMAMEWYLRRKGGVA